MTPRVFCCAEDFPKHVALPRGCLNEIKELPEQWGAQLAGLLGIDLREIGIIGGGKDELIF